MEMDGGGEGQQHLRVMASGGWGGWGEEQQQGLHEPAQSFSLKIASKPHCCRSAGGRGLL